MVNPNANTIITNAMTTNTFSTVYQKSTIDIFIFLYNKVLIASTVATVQPLIAIV